MGERPTPTGSCIGAGRASRPAPVRLPRDNPKGTIMKAIYLALLTLGVAFAVPALADPVVIDGCEVRQSEGGTHFVKVDPTCAFDRVGLGETADGKLNPRNPAS